MHARRWKVLTRSMHAFCLPTTIPSLLNVEISRVAVAVVVDDHCSLERHLLLGLALAQSSPVQPSQAKPGLPLSHPSTSPGPPTLFSTTGAGRPHAWRCVQLCEWLAGSPDSTSRGPVALPLVLSQPTSPWDTVEGVASTRTCRCTNDASSRDAHTLDRGSPLP